MTMDRLERSRGWLFVLGILLLVALAAVAWQANSLPSHAAPSERLLAAADRLPAADPVTPTIYLPSLLNHFETAWLAVDKVVYPTSLIAGPDQVVTYTVTISNGGDTTGTLLSVVDTLPPDFVFQSMAAGSDVDAAPDATSSTITWSGLWSMAPGQVLTLVYRVVAGQEPGLWSNQVLVTAQEAHVPAEPAVADLLVEPAVLLEEYFETGIHRWTEFLNHHRLEPGQWYYGGNDGIDGSGGLTHDCCVGSLVASDALMMYLQPGAEEWTDYRVETKMLLTGGVHNDGSPEPNAGDPIGLWIRGHYQGGPDMEESQWVSGYYVVLVGKSDDPVHFVRIAKMQQPGDCEACLKPYRMYNFDNPMFKARSADLPGPFEHYRWYTLAVEVRGANIQVFLDGELVLNWTDPLLPFLSGTVGFKVHETKTATFDNVIVTPLH